MPNGHPQTSNRPLTDRERAGLAVLERYFGPAWFTLDDCYSSWGLSEKLEGRQRAIVKGLLAKGRMQRRANPNPPDRRKEWWKTDSYYQYQILTESGEPPEGGGRWMICERCGRPVPVHDEAEHPAWCDECYNEHLGGEEWADD